jgi:transposase-like protein
MDRLTKCKIVSVGKRRDGGTRYWCLEHKADATAKYGRRARSCRYAHISPIEPQEILTLSSAEYRGGIALWGAVPPIYDTTRQAIDRGIHVHARSAINGHKEIDATYRSVRLIDEHKDIPPEGCIISELDAIYYLVTSTFGCPMKYVECTLCRYPHLDKDWFSVHAHQRHLCAGCGKTFRDTESGIGNPVMKVRRLFKADTCKPKRSQRSLSIRQADYPGGIQIWGSNPAILWTAARREEEGIHIHAFGERDELLIDETFGRVTIDGLSLDPSLVRIFMAQNSLPHIAGRITHIYCPQCNEAHFEIGEQMFTPHDQHTCAKCGFEFRSGGRLRKTIGNPISHLLPRLAENAPRTPQQHKSDLLPETL